MSRTNGEKARANIAHKKRTARRMKERALRAELLGAEQKGTLESLKESKPVAVAAKTLKKAGEALAELAELAKPKRAKKSAE